MALENSGEASKMRSLMHEESKNQRNALLDTKVQGKIGYQHTST